MEEKYEKTVELKSNAVLSNYIKEFADDVKLNEFNLKQKSMLCSSIWAKWLSYLFLEKSNLQRIIDAKQKILSSKLASSKNSSMLKLKSEEKLSENDENIQKLNALFKCTQDCIDYIERSLNILSSFGFNIKNTIDALKLQLTH